MDNWSKGWSLTTTGSNKQMTIRWKLIGIFSSIIVVVTLLSSFVAVEQFSESVKDEINARLDRGSEITQIYFMSHANEAFGIAKILARKEEVADVILGNITPFLSNPRVINSSKYFNGFDVW